jgi:5-methyltetrahydrofolate--homocysteine methyltransferase
MLLEGAGFEVHDLGVDVAPEDFVRAVEATRPHLLCMSALLTTTMPVMGAIIEAVNEAELRNQVKIMVGGAPVSEAFAERIGADGYAPDAARAVEAAGDLVPK